MKDVKNTIHGNIIDDKTNLNEFIDTDPIQLWALHQYDEKKVKKTMEEMNKLGTPIIKYVNPGSFDFMALEGTQRLEAARRLKIIPKFIELQFEDIFTHDADFIKSPCTVEDFLDCFFDRFGQPKGNWYEFKS